jgi:APA family basic amino acid/polyamine antiporter
MTTAARRSIFRRMPVDRMDEIEAESGASALTKSLGLWQLTAIGVGGIIGVGIFSLAGLVAHGDADNPGVGPAVLIAFLIAGLASAAAAVSYAEFAGMIPRAGSAYTYGYVALGEIIGWFIGWDLLLEYIAIVAVVAIGISGYLEAFLDGFGVALPLSITAFAEEGGVVNVPGRTGAPVRPLAAELPGSAPGAHHRVVVAGVEDGEVPGGQVRHRDGEVTARPVGALPVQGRRREVLAR